MLKFGKLGNYIFCLCLIILLCDCSQISEQKATSIPLPTIASTWTPIAPPIIHASPTSTWTPIAPPTIVTIPTSTWTPIAPPIIHASPTSTWTPTLSLLRTATRMKLISPTPSATLCAIRTPSGWQHYVIQGGDTLFGLAMLTNTTVAKLQEVNCLSDTIIRLGSAIYLPQLPPPSPIAPSTIPSVLPPPTSPPSPTVSPPLPPTPSPIAPPLVTPYPGGFHKIDYQTENIHS